jgi:exonuclease III
MSFNCRSLKSSTVDFINKLADRADAPDVICLQEIWRPGASLLSGVALGKHYAVHHRLRPASLQASANDNGGGVAVLVRREYYDSRPVWTAPETSAAEGIAVHVTRHSDSFHYVIASVYWPPQSRI